MTINPANEGDDVSFREVSTGNVSLDDVSGDGLLSHAVEHGTVWADDGQLYSSVQSAIDNATGYVLAGPGTFNEAVTITTADLTLEGVGPATIIDGGTSDHGVEAGATGVEVKNLAAKTTAGGGNPFNGIFLSSDNTVVRNCVALESDSEGVFVNADSCRVEDVRVVSSSIDEDDVLLGAGSSNSYADGVLGTVTDSGTGNTVGDTA